MRRRADVVVAAALACVAVATWYFRMIVPADTTARLFRTSDFFTQIYPMWLRAAEWLRDGVFPLWNPYQVCGHPFLATGIYGLLYPPNLLHLVLPTASAIEAVIVINLVAAGVGTYAYARTVIGRIDAAFVAAATFMLSGFVLFEASWFPPASASAAWLPLALLAVERIFRRGGVRWVIVLALAIALSFLGGWMQTWLYTLYVLAAYTATRLAVFAARPETRARAVEVAARLAIAVGLALLVVAPQLLPMLELHALGPRRVGGLTLEQALAAGVLQPAQLMTNALDARPAWPRSAYLGMNALLLIPLSWFAATARWRLICFWLLAIFALCVAVSIYTPLFQVYRLIGGSWFRGPARILFVYAFAGAVLTGLGFAAVATAEERGRRWIAVVALAIAAGLCSVAMPWESRPYVLAGTTLLVSAVAVPWPGLRRALLAGLALLIVLDLTLAVRNPYRRPIHGVEAYDRNATAFAFVKANQGLDRMYVSTRFDVAEVMAKQGTLREIYAINDYEPLSLNRYERFFRTVELAKERRPDHLTFTGSLHASPTAPEFRMLDLMSVRYVLIGKMAMNDHVAFRDRRWPIAVHPTDGDVVVYENPAPLPRAYVAAGVEVADSEDAALAAVSREGFDARATVVVEPPEDASPRVVSAPPGPLATAEIISYAPTRVVVRSDAPRAGHLVLTDTFYPGWTATVDGTPAPILHANYLFRAVPVGAGEHEVIFRYEPRSFYSGLALGLAGVAAMVALGVVGLRRRR